MRSPEPKPGRKARPALGWIAVAGLLTLYAAMTLWAASVKGSGFDEGEHLFTGYNIWLRGDFRMESANGDFVKRWATLPYLVTRPKMIGMADKAWRAGDAYSSGSKFLFELGNNADALLFQGRVMIMLLGVATGLLVFGCARELFGWSGGLLALGVFVFSPNMLAFGAIVSTEMSLCLALLGSTWCVWRLLHRITWGRIAGSLAMFAMLVLSKPTAILILPTVAGLLAFRLVVARPLEVAVGPRRVVTRRGPQSRYFFALTALHAVVGWMVIWAHYDFRYLASPNPADPGVTTATRTHPDPISPVVQRTIRWARAGQWLPQGFLHGIEWLLGHNDERHAFLAGEWTYGGWRQFFLRAALAKTRPAFALLLLLGLVWWIKRWWQTCRGPPNSAAATPAVPSFYEATPYLAFCAIYLSAAIAQNLNIGHRHILPLYPAGYVLTGSVALLWAVARPWVRTLIAALCLYFVVETVGIAPNFLAYFSPLTGGPAKGYTQLVDSSLDWGMNLPGLKHWLDEKNPGGSTPVYLAYFGTDSPSYRGIACHRLPGFFDRGRGEHFPLTPGLYAISATLLETVYTRTFGPWNKVYEREYRETGEHIVTFERTANDPVARAALIRENSVARWEQEYEMFENLRFGRLCAWLRHHRSPDADIGYAILIWRLDAAELQQALFGPPAELADEPVLPP